MKSLKIIVKNVKEAGVEQAEKALVAVFNSVEKAVPEILLDTECSAIEKTAAGIIAPVLATLKPQFEKLVDFDKDGQVG